MAAEVLSNPPLKEIVFAISFKEVISNKDLEVLVSSIANFKVIGENYTNSLSEVNSTLVTTKNHDGYILQDENLRSIYLEIKRGVFSLHKTDNYDGFESIYGQFLNCWQTFQNAVGKKLTIINLRLRYLNFLKLNEGDSNASLVKITVSHPYGDLAGAELTKINFPYKGNNKIVANVNLANVRDPKDGIGLVLDILINYNVEDEIGDNKAEMFLILREIKNEIFFNSLTDKAKNRYL